MDSLDSPVQHISHTQFIQHLSNDKQPIHFENEIFDPDEIIHHERRRTQDITNAIQGLTLEMRQWGHVSAFCLLSLFFCVYVHL